MIRIVKKPKTTVRHCGRCGATPRTLKLPTYKVRTKWSRSKTGWLCFRCKNREDHRAAYRKDKETNSPRHQAKLQRAKSNRTKSYQTLLGHITSVFGATKYSEKVSGRVFGLKKSHLVGSPSLMAQYTPLFYQWQAFKFDEDHKPILTKRDVRRPYSRNNVAWTTNEMIGKTARGETLKDAINDRAKRTEQQCNENNKNVEVLFTSADLEALRRK